ncbi:epoxide hydrolase [Pluteus cervinus]|uniref:Epoxide hydrolase n=1 Tax=Pluteus cervinus TaxID=181527 RepID=A0ACD3BER5_9AGAR|nr:epoxide hydrolase [Pluteus cervinus]
MTCPNLKAVIFDIGGVVLRSPFIAIAQYERDHGIPRNYLNCSIVERGPDGAWQKFERGELPLLEFYAQFGKDLSDTLNGNKWYKDYCDRRGIPCPQLPELLEVDGRKLFGAMMRESTYDPHIRLAIEHLRQANRYKIIALTNNFSRIDIPATERAFLGWTEEGPAPLELTRLFDDFCDSSILGLRKPDPAFYLLACSRNNIKPENAVFLDDIGINLKAAKKLGMETILVSIGKTLEAVQKLEEMLGMNLTDPIEALKISKL